MTSQIETRPARILSSKYSSSESYFFSKLISNIIQEKRSPLTTAYQDIDYLIDQDEYMKRMYKIQQNRNKMNMFKQYYFYHQDCPRIFIQDIQIIYAKWQDRKRNYMYKKLKHLLDDEKSNDSMLGSQEEVNGVTHFLFQLSQYNPFSKKYYLRTQSKKQKQNQKRQNEQNVHTRDQISFLRHDLSCMLKQMNQLSAISTLDSTRIQSKSKIYHRKTMTQGQSGSYQFSNSNSKSIIKLNFKKKSQKIVINQPKIMNKNYKDAVITSQIQKFKNDKELVDVYQNSNSRQNSPKLYPVENKQGSLQKFKSKSIYAFTSLGQLNNFGQQNKTRINSKREQLKIDFDLKAQKASKKSMQTNQQIEKINKNHQTVQKRKTLDVRYNSIGKIIPNKLQAIQIGTRQVSLRKLKTKPDQFCDKKLALINKNVQKKLISYKSQHSANKKPSFKIKNNIQQINIQNKKKKLQIKL